MSAKSGLIWKVIICAHGRLPPRSQAVVVQSDCGDLAASKLPGWLCNLMTALFGCHRNHPHSDFNQTKDSCVQTMHSPPCALVKFTKISVLISPERAGAFELIYLVSKSGCSSLFNCQSSAWFKSITWTSESYKPQCELTRRFLYLFVCLVFPAPFCLK